MQIRPFEALRPRPDLAGKVAAPPYDVLDVDEARRLAEGNPYTFLHVNRSEIDLPAATDPRDPKVYERAAANLRRFVEEGWLVREARPSLYVYRQQLGDHAQHGLVALCSVADYEHDVIRRHEHTRPVPEADRARHIDAVDAQVGPVFLAFRDRADLAALIAADAATEPLYDFEAADGVRHTVWIAADPSAYVAAFAALPSAYIADGHHRAAGARRVAEQRRERPGGAGEAEWFLSVIFPAGELKILPYNRCVRDLGGLEPPAFLDQVRAAGFDVRPDAPDRPEAPGGVSLYLAGRWYGLRWEVAADADAVSALDASVLQDRLLGPVLGIGDPRKDERLSFVGGIRGTRELVRRVDSGRDAAAFSMYPTSMDQLMAVADAGRTMPPKSTWFEPKLRSGLLVHALH